MPRKVCKKGFLSLKSNMAVDESALALLLQWLQHTIGLNAQSVSPSALEYHIRQRMQACQLPTLSAYHGYLQHHAQEAEHLIQAVVIPETWFFRDEGAFAALTQHLQTQFNPLPHPLRIASIPCSTGEEPYSIAIHLLELGLQPDQFRVEAFDISPAALTKAQQAIYREHSFRTARTTTTSFQARYFQALEEGHYQLNTEIQALVEFNVANILTQAYKLQPIPYHFIFCRNLLIYFDGEAQQKTLNSLGQALHPQGLLFVGYAEATLAHQHGFDMSPYHKAFAFTKPTPTRLTAPSTPNPAQSQIIANSQSRTQHRRRAAPLQPLAAPPKPNTPPLPTLAEIKQLADQGQLTAALPLCQRYLQQQEYVAEAHFLCGTICLGLHLNEQAQQAFRKVTYLEPNHYEALCYLALLAQQQGDEATATLMQQRAKRAQQRLKS